ncbi:isoprenylcysteine carboxylmethyltransferase family protein [Nocardia sp. NPDC051030]|uniref:methyltransferase family protein n=1 Tax=Nocardia sp. NPDC051030 TaxID=3155162 RepID=UPI0034258566
MDIVDLLVRVAGWSIQAVGWVWLGTAVWFAARRAGSLWERVRHFLSTFLPEPGMIVGIVVLIVVVYALPRSLWEPVSWSSRVLIAVGSVLVVLSAALMVWARLALGAMWAGRPLIQEEHELRTDGPYRWVRHPIYTGILGTMIGLTLMVGFGAALVILVFVVGWLLWRVRVEDRMLIATFGRSYEEYRAAVPALVPQFRPLARQRVSPGGE